MTDRGSGSPARRRLGPRIRQVRVPRRGLALGVVALAAVIGGYLLWRSPSMLPETDPPVRFFQIATGSTSGTYYPVGETIATMISQPPGGAPCVADERCGVPGLLAVVKSSQGSIANVRSLADGRYDAALAQADVASWAYSATGIFAGQEPLANLRAIAGLYEEAVQLVVARRIDISSVAELKGLRVSIDRPGSGTRADALLILKAHGLSPDDVELVEVDTGQTADVMAAGGLDAFFFVAGTPAGLVTELAAGGIARLLPIDGPEVEALMAENPFFVHHVIPAGTYPGVGEIATLAVKALLVASSALPFELARDLTAALWRPGNRPLLEAGHAKGREIRLETALDGVPIPLHPGAESFYRAAGRL
jgi:hypothetical protein